MTTIDTLDVTQIEPQLRHPAIFNQFDRLKNGEGFVILNDHDPQPLYYQLKGERGDTFTWEYLEQGPRWWKVRIMRRSLELTGETVGSLAAKDYRKAEVFKKLGIDFCCGGAKTLNEACQEAGISESELRAALEQSELAPAIASQDYLKWEPDFLVDFIINTHHRYVKEHSGIINGLVRKVADRHGDAHPELHDMAESTARFFQELASHMMKEENMLFPNIKLLVSHKRNPAGRLNVPEGMVAAAIRVMQVEHEVAGEDLRFFRELTHDYTLPEDACNSYHYLFEKMKEFENDLFHHIHLENNILFPKALELEQKVAGGIQLRNE